MKAVRIQSIWWSGSSNLRRGAGGKAAQGPSAGASASVRAESFGHLGSKRIAGRETAHILGSDIAGEVAEIGEYVAGFKPGSAGADRPHAFLWKLRENAFEDCRTVPRITVLVMESMAETAS